MSDPGAGPAGTLALTTSSEEQLLASVRRALAADYAVEREVGRGGMAVVFKARDNELDRPVALKVLPPELAPVATVAERFKREARLAASLEHPNIIPVYRVGQAGGVLYMAMKFIDGRSLEALITEHGPLPLPVIVTVLRAAARALAYAHEHGIVHRDIKGANILIDRDGRVVVSDFGIARAVESTTLTATGVAIGTPHFMSPEQCGGKPVGPQSDQYSLGIVAYQMLTGAVPFDGESLPEILQHHWFSTPPDATLARPDTPAAMTAAVRRLLAKDPAGRFASTNDLVAALDHIPFAANDRAAGEAALRALVAPSRAPDAPAQPAITAPVLPELIATGPVVTSVATVIVPTPTTATLDAAAASTPVRPRGPATRPLATIGASPASSASPAPGKSSSSTPRRKPRRRWSTIAGVAIVLVLAIAAGVSRRAGRARAASHPSSVPPRLNAVVMRDAGGKAYQSGHFELARRFYVRAVAADPNDARAQQQLGCTLLKLGRSDSARVYLAGANASGCE